MLKWKPLNVITLKASIFDHINRIGFYETMNNFIKQCSAKMGVGMKIKIVNSIDKVKLTEDSDYSEDSKTL